MATTEDVIAAVHATLVGDASSMFDQYRNDTTKLVAGSLFYQLRAAIQALVAIDANNTVEITSMELEFFYRIPQSEDELVFTTWAGAGRMQPILRKWLNKATWEGITGIRNVASEGSEFDVAGDPELSDVERVADVIKFTVTATVVVEP